MSLLASLSNNLKIWDFHDDSLRLSSTAEFVGLGTETSSREATDLLALAWNHSQKVIAVGGTGQKLHLVQADTGGTIATLPFGEKESFIGDVRALSFSHNSKYLASAIEQDVVVWDLKNKNIRVRLSGHKTVVKTIQYTNDGCVVSGDTSGTMIIWNVEQNTRSKELLNPGYRSPLNSLKLSPSNHRHICCGYGDGSVTVWDSQTLTALHRCHTAHTSAVTAVAYSPKNDRLIITGGKDGMLHLVDLGSRHDKFVPAVSVNVGEHITSVSFHDSALYTAVGTDSGYVYVYDLRNSRKPVVQLSAHNPMPVHELAFQQTPPPKVTRGGGKTSSSSSSSSSSSVASSTASVLDRAPLPAPPLQEHLHQPQQQQQQQQQQPPASVSPSPSSSFALPVSSSAPSFTNNHRTAEKPLRSSAHSTQEQEREPVLTSRSVHSHSASASLPPPPSALLSSPRGDSGVGGSVPVPVSASATSSLSSRVQAHVHAGDSSTYTTPSPARAPAPSPSPSHSFSQHHHQQQQLPSDHSSDDVIAMDDHSVESHIRGALRPVTNQQLTEALQLIQYDVHREVQGVIREQVRQFSIAKEETAEMIDKLSEQLREVLAANKELRAENERLRHIY